MTPLSHNPPRVACLLIALGAAWVLGFLGSGCASSSDQPRAVSMATQTGVASALARRTFVWTDAPPHSALGVVALVNPQNPPFRLESIPLSRGEASADTSGRAALALLPGAGGAGEAIILLPPALLVAAVGGALYGATQGGNASEIQQATEVLRRVAASFAPAHALAATFLAHGHTLSTTAIAQVEDYFPTEVPESRLRLHGGINGSVGAVRMPPPAHRLATRGIDTAALLEVVHELPGSGAHPNTHVLAATVRLRLVRTHDWALVGEFEARHVSAARPFIAWAANDAQAVREEFSAALHALEEHLALWLQRASPQTPALPAPPNGSNKVGDS